MAKRQSYSGMIMNIRSAETEWFRQRHTCAWMKMGKRFFPLCLSALRCLQIRKHWGYRSYEQNVASCDSFLAGKSSAAPPAGILLC